MDSVIISLLGFLGTSGTIFFLFLVTNESKYSTVSAFFFAIR